MSTLVEWSALIGLGSINTSSVPRVALPGVDDVLLLVGGALAVEQPPVALDGRADAFHLLQLGQALLQPLPPRPAVEEFVRVVVLLGDPRPGLGGVLILQPAVGIGHDYAMQSFLNIALAGGRWRGHGCAGSLGQRQKAGHITAQDRMPKILRFMISSDRAFCGPDHAMSSKVRGSQREELSAPGFRSDRSGGVPMLILRFVGFLLMAAVSFAQSAPPEQAKEPEQAITQLTADEIMARVAANQDRSEALRKQYVYLSAHPHPHPQAQGPVAARRDGGL